MGGTGVGQVGRAGAQDRWAGPRTQDGYTAEARVRCCIMNEHKARRQVQKTFVTEGTCMSVEGEKLCIDQISGMGETWASNVHQVA